MKTIQEIAKERLVYHERLNLQKNKPIYTVHRFSVYKLRIIKRLYSSDYGELNFLLQDDQNPVEKCIVYALMWKPNKLNQIKYWRATMMDLELAGYIVNAFIHDYLMKRYTIQQ